MENYLWQKTLLDMYHVFDRAVIIADNKFDKLVSSSIINCNTNSLFDELMGLMARKNNCLLAKELVDNTLKYLNENNKNILCDYYKYKMPFKSIAQKEQINIRQVFRNFDKELASFAFILSKQGYSNEELERCFGGDNLFAQAYEKLALKTSNKPQIFVQLPNIYNDDIKKNDCESIVSNDSFLGTHQVFLHC